MNETATTLFARFFARQALIYYLMCLPALVSELLFSLTIASSPQLVPEIASFNGLVPLVVQVIPWLVMALSLYTLISFRPSILIGLLTVSFFIAASVTTSMTFFGYPFSLGAAVALVVGSTFTTLVGFNFSRGAKLLGGRKLFLRSKGPAGYQLLSLSVELILPLAAAVGLVLLVSVFFDALKAQSLLLPQPLSTLTSLYLGTVIGLAFTTILIAGAIIWVLRQLVEPVIMYFSITSSDAKTLALGEIRDITTKLGKDVGSRRDPVGFRWIIPGALISLFLLVYIEKSLGGFGNLEGAFMQAVTMHSTGTTPHEVSFQNSANSLAVQIDETVIKIENFIRALFTFLWG